jgi:Lon protease (S16) C-terminal proteolytic domain
MMDNRPSGQVQSDAPVEDQFRAPRLTAGPQLAQRRDALARHRARIRRVILPRHSEAELTEVPPDLGREMEFVLVDTIRLDLDHARESPPTGGVRRLASG